MRLINDRTIEAQKKFARFMKAHYDALKITPAEKIVVMSIMDHHVAFYQQMGIPPKLSRIALETLLEGAKKSDELLERK